MQRSVEKQRHHQILHPVGMQPHVAGRIPTECEDYCVPSISTERFIPTG